MMTISAELPKTFTVPLRKSCSNHTIHRADPRNGHQRSRRDALRMLVGVDGARFPDFPKRRYVRSSGRTRRV